MPPTDLDPVALAFLSLGVAATFALPPIAGVGARRLSAGLLGTAPDREPPWPGIHWPRWLGWIAGFATLFLVLIAWAGAVDAERLSQALLTLFSASVRLGVGIVVLALCTLVADRLPREGDFSFHRTSLVVGGTLVAVAAIAGLGGLAALLALLVVLGALGVASTPQQRLGDLLGDVAAGMKLRARRLGGGRVEIGGVAVGLGPVGLLTTVIREGELERPMRNEMVLALVEPVRDGPGEPG